MIILEHYLTVLEDLKITQREFLVLLCIHEKDLDSIIRYKKLFQLGKDNSLLMSEEIKSLVDRKLLSVLDNKGIMSSYKVSNNFIKYFQKNKIIDEFFSTYPAYLKTANKNYPLKGVDKDEIGNLYYKKIKKSIFEHLEILEDLQYGLKNNLILVKIDNFVKSEGWLDIRKERTNNNTSKKTREILS